MKTFKVTMLVRVKDSNWDAFDVRCELARMNLKPFELVVEPKAKEVHADLKEGRW